MTEQQRQRIVDAGLDPDDFTPSKTDKIAELNAQIAELNAVIDALLEGRTE